MSYGLISYEAYKPAKMKFDVLADASSEARDASWNFYGCWFVVSVVEGGNIANIIYCYKDGYRVKHSFAFPDGTTQLQAIEILNRLWNA